MSEYRDSLAWALLFLGGMIILALVHAVGDWAERVWGADWRASPSVHKVLLWVRGLLLTGFLALLGYRYREGVPIWAYAAGALSGGVWAILARSLGVFVARRCRLGFGRSADRSRVTAISLGSLAFLLAALSTICLDRSSAVDTQAIVLTVLPAGIVVILADRRAVPIWLNALAYGLLYPVVPLSWMLLLGSSTASQWAIGLWVGMVAAGVAASWAVDRLLPWPTIVRR